MSRSSVVPWWISWYTHRPLSEFELHSPWWVSGYADGEDGRGLTIIVAAVLAESEEGAWAVVLGAFDEPRSDSDIKRRFCDEQPLGAMVADSIFDDRWPKAEWMAWSPQDGITCACGCERSAR